VRLQKSVGEDRGTGAMAYNASHRFARIAASKVRPFTDLIRGRPAGKALELLKYEPNRGARMLEKVLASAMANAEDQGARNVDRMLVVDARANNGPMFKRILPRARGMAFMIRRRFAHIDVAIDAPVVG
jgi:large subunit ribosomal protein L22